MPAARVQTLPQNRFSLNELKKKGGRSNARRTHRMSLAAARRPGKTPAGRIFLGILAAMAFPATAFSAEAKGEWLFRGAKGARRIGGFRRAVLGTRFVESR